MLEHLPEPCVWLSHLRRVLKPGGHVFTEVPDAAPYARTKSKGQFHAVLYSAASYAEATSWHRISARWTDDGGRFPRRYRELMRRAGFEYVAASELPGVVRMLHRLPPAASTRERQRRSR